MRHVLQVGEKERHELVIQLNTWFSKNKLTIYVDGTETSTLDYFYFGKQTTNTKFKVGKDEIHDVEVKVSRTGLVSFTLYVFVDEKLIYTNSWTNIP
jgi:hypothetical protein